MNSIQSLVSFGLLSLSLFLASCVSDGRGYEVGSLDLLLDQQGGRDCEILDLLVRTPDGRLECHGLDSDWLKMKIAEFPGGISWLGGEFLTEAQAEFCRKAEKSALQCRGQSRLGIFASSWRLEGTKKSKFVDEIAIPWVSVEYVQFSETRISEILQKYPPRSEFGEVVGVIDGAHYGFASFLLSELAIERRGDKIESVKTESVNGGLHVLGRLTDEGIDLLDKVLQGRYSEKEVEAMVDRKNLAKYVKGAMPIGYTVRKINCSHGCVDTNPLNAITVRIVD